MTLGSLAATFRIEVLNKDGYDHGDDYVLPVNATLKLNCTSSGPVAWTFLGVSKP